MSDDGVLAAHDAFYAAFEAADMVAMTEVWAHSDDVVCTHPGWPTRRGWEAVARSWESIFAAGASLQFILTGVEVSRRGDVAWMTVDENLVGVDGPGGTVAALNAYVRGDGRWQMVVHHGSPVMRR